MGVFTRDGSVNLGGIYFKNLSQNTELYLGLIASDYTGDLDYITFAQISEPTAVTYARKTMLPANWVQSGELVVYPTQDFEVSLEALGTIYGVFIATSLDNSGKIVAAHLFDTPLDLLYYGDILELTPKITIT
jgi:hypothetical protein